MTIKTLRYIHDLLIEEESKTLRIQKWTSNTYYEAESNGNATEQQRKDKDLAWESHSAALDALQEFESHEW